MIFSVHDDKIFRYLLSEDTEVASGKSKFFRSIGFSHENAEGLKSLLAQHPHTARLEKEEATAYGRKRVYLCHLPPAPDGASYCVRSVWMDDGEEYRLITVYPRPDGPVRATTLG